MLLTIFHFLLVLSIILAVINRKWLVLIWKWIFRQLRFLFQLVFQLLKKILGFFWLLLKGFLKMVWMGFVKLFKGLFYLVPRLIYWLGWVLLESFKFLFYALKALVDILKP